MNNDDADLSGSTDRYAMAGTYVMDLTAKYSNNPSVKHSIRLRLVVEEVKDVQVAAAGTSGSKQSLVAVQHSQYLLGTLAILLQSMIWIVTVKIAGQLN